ncbi:hypothetical protein RDI58_010571 [Solanum bulbocastanum]|uniref:Uncharacterized protein n=1 Tax=Solanum bulbocastanum TaxID=147425 RepID=A0AAN8TQS4_SOLBU
MIYLLKLMRSLLIIMMCMKKFQNPRESNEEFRRGELIRDGIAATMWNNYEE